MDGKIGFCYLRVCTHQSPILFYALIMKNDNKTLNLENVDRKGFWKKVRLFLDRAISWLKMNPLIVTLVLLDQCIKVLVFLMQSVQAPLAPVPLSPRSNRYREIARIIVFLTH